jgi:hypothetical protein
VPPDAINRLVAQLAKLPGIGEKTAQRLAFHVLRSPPEYARGLAAALNEVVDRVKLCGRCFSLHDGPEGTFCGYCSDTRRDDRAVCVVEGIADELAMLQDQVPPFPSAVAMATIERAFRRPVGEIFEQFEETPVASASIAQVHFALLRDAHGGIREVAVKVLRPGMRGAIDKDLALMAMMAGWVEKLSPDGKRLKPREVVGEFDKNAVMRLTGEEPHALADLLRGDIRRRGRRRLGRYGRRRGQITHVGVKRLLGGLDIPRGEFVDLAGEMRRQFQPVDVLIIAERRCDDHVAEVRVIGL